MRMRAVGKLLVLIGGLFFSVAVAAQDLPTGRIVPMTMAAGKGSYALYLPTTYNGVRAFPVLFVLDPRGRGAVAAEIFRPAAERFGYIVLSSNDSRSDTAEDLNFPAISALATEAERRFKIDKQRVYLAGFSGTARFAFALARQSMPHTFAGIIGSGAGYPPGLVPLASDTTPIYATVGTGDFNWPEMMKLEPALRKAGIRHFLEVFDGDHQWATAPVMMRALGWFELQAMRQGTKQPDANEVAALWTDWTAAAQAAETAGRYVEAEDLWSAAADAFAGLQDTSLATSRASALRADPRYAAAVAERRRLTSHDETEMTRAFEAFGMDNVGQAASLLNIDGLKRKAAQAASIEERASARRLLNYIGVQSGFYLSNQAIDAKDWTRADFLLSLALKASWQPASALYRRAGVYARIGRTQAALADLHSAVAAGFKNRSLLEQDDAFKSLRGTAAFNSILASIGS